MPATSGITNHIDKKSKFVPILIRKKIRILLTGGGTGGHIYPLLAVADYLKEVGESSIRLSFAGQTGRFQEEFDDRYIRTYRIFPSKLRRYFSIYNFFDGPLFIISVFQALFSVYFEMPDVVFSKGGPGTLAVVLAAKFYKIPVLVHESDAVPGIGNRLAARYAERVAISFDEAAEFFPGKTVVFTGNPVRKELIPEWTDKRGAKSFFRFNPELPVLLVLGGSQGSTRINNFIFDNLAELLGKVQICHQVGPGNEKEAENTARLETGKTGEFGYGGYAARGFFDKRELKIAMNASDIILSRAGSGAISEIALFGKPSILIPLSGSANDHQKANAYAYAKTGAALILEEDNLKPHVLLNEIKKVLENPEQLTKMGAAAKAFAKPLAANAVGREALGLTGINLETQL